MKLQPGMTRDDVYKALEASVLAVWGAERLEADREIIGVAAKNIWSVISIPLSPFSEEMDLHQTHFPREE